VIRPQTNVNAYAAPFYRGLTIDQCRLIHDASLEILERTGVEMYYQPARDLLKSAGCIVKENRVQIPGYLIERALRTAPNQILMYNRQGKPAMRLGGRVSSYGTGSDCLNILDHRSNQRRKAALQDVVDGIRVADALPQIDFIMSMFLPNDVGAGKELRQMEVMLTHSSKPICFVTYGWEGTPEIVEMLELASGGANQFQNRPSAILYINPTSGFRHNEEALQKLMYMAERHHPCVYWPEVGGLKWAGG